jgi:hypothetical protein
VLVVQAGEDAHRGGAGPQDRAQAVEAVGAGEVEVEQHAVAAREQAAVDHVGHGLGHAHLQRGVDLCEQFLARGNVARVVLHQQRVPGRGRNGQRHTELFSSRTRAHR